MNAASVPPGNCEPTGNISSSTNAAAASTPLIGRVEWIGLRPARRADVQQVVTAIVLEKQGLHGDHGHKSVRSQRQVTLIQAEHLPEIAERQGLPEVRPEQLRRNIVVSGLPLLSLKGKAFRIGTAVLVATGDCSPCARMAEALGEGAQRAMSNRGGIIARVASGGEISVGDQVAQTDTFREIDSVEGE